MPTALNFDDLDNLIEGAAFLGSGGGGPVSLARTLLATMKQQGLVPELVDWTEVAPDAWVASVAGIGSPNAAAAVEAPFTVAPRRMVQSLEQALGRSLDLLIPGETGPMNSLIPMIAAAQLGKPVLDGDGAGRAMATLAMSTFNEAAPVQPYLLGNETDTADNQVTANLTVHTPEQADALTRGIVSEASFGSSGAFATWPCQAGRLGEVAVQGSVRQAIEVGALLKQARAAGTDPLNALQALFGDRMHCLYSGFIDQVDSHTAQGFDITQIRMKADGEAGLTIYALNENMMAWRDDLPHPLGIGPDSLCYVSEDGHAFTNANLDDYLGHKDKRVHLIGLEALPALRKPVIVSAYRTALRPMGYPGPYRPLSHWNDD
ncbi:DUF917 domain-containing protein [Saccharospirillum salsuginis]|uniref:DUF917 domain-containing protein n=1 Tax=Saccharospirillum salsuginis TaxID=418750 RepID=A0A918K5J3_9GAMM|nr:DUF917 domain-containing protein [Saccharospirillum salsuginis]GGX49084.1 hypothetical protein GCM10007392_15440 [Saccharospirillum salsuginis]